MKRHKLLQQKLSHTLWGRLGDAFDDEIPIEQKIVISIKLMDKLKYGVFFKLANAIWGNKI